MKEHPILFNGAMVRAILAGEKTQTRRVLKQATGPSLSVGIEDEPGVAELSWLYGDGPGYEVHETVKRVPCPYGKPGDRLWVRETWMDLLGTGVEHRPTPASPIQRYAYGADCPAGSASDEVRKDYGLKWKPSIHMPRAASRILLEIVSVRVERLQDISEADADAEGCERLDFEREVRDHSVCWCCGGTRLYTSFSNGGACPDTDCRECDTYAKRYRHLWESINGQHSWMNNPWVWVIEFRRVQP